jgi:hypothetical protein
VKSIYVIKEAILAIASFFVPKNSTVSSPSFKDILYQRDTYDSNYSFASEENQHNMIYDFAHLMADNSVGIELFEFEEPRMPKGESRGYKGFFHICLISDDIEKLAVDVAASGGKRRSDL